MLQSTSEPGEDTERDRIPKVVTLETLPNRSPCTFSTPDAHNRYSLNCVCISQFWLGVPSLPQLVDDDQLNFEQISHSYLKLTRCWGMQYIFPCVSIIRIFFWSEISPWFKRSFAPRPSEYTTINFNVRRGAC